MSGKSYIDIAFVLAVILQFTKLSDLALREHQKKSLQDSFERLTLWIAYAKPLDYFNRSFRNKGVMRRLLIFTILIVVVLNVWSLLLMTYRVDFGDVEYDFYLYLIILVSSVSTYYLFKSYGLKFSAWWTENGVKIFFKRFLLMFVGSIILVILIVGLEALGLHFISRLFIVLLIITGIVFAFILIFYYALFISIFLIIQLLFEVVLKVTQFIIWRIVEYNKGVVAAITLILTVILGMAMLFIPK